MHSGEFGEPGKFKVGLTRLGSALRTPESAPNDGARIVKREVRASLISRAGPKVFLSVFYLRVLSIDIRLKSSQARTFREFKLNQKGVACPATAQTRYQATSKVPTSDELA